MTRHLSVSVRALGSFPCRGDSSAEDDLRREFLCSARLGESLVLLVVAQRRGQQGGHHPRLRGDEESRGSAGRCCSMPARRDRRRRAGRAFMSAEWRELYKHAVREADRCGIVLSVNLCSGWNAGGPWVTPEHAAKKTGRRRRRSSKGRDASASLCRKPAGGAGILPRHRRAGVPDAGRRDRRAAS